MPIIPAKKDRTPLDPIRHPNNDFFVCDITDAIPKDDMGSMEHPMFTLSKRADRRTLTYEHRNIKIEVTPSVKGLATIHDKDILIYCISQLVAKMNAGLTPKRTMLLTAYDLLVATNRPTGGEAYRRLEAALDRLSGTRIKTNLETNAELVTSGFGMIDDWQIVRKRRDGRMVSISITVSKWLFNAVLGKEVLTLNRDYFRLGKAIERRIYEIARKHCGKQNEWRIKMDLLHKKVGSSDTVRKLRMKVKALEKFDDFPDYDVSVENNVVIFRNKESWWETKYPAEGYPTLDTETFHDAKGFAEQARLDVYGLEQDWHQWWDESGRPPLSSPDKAFIGYCRMRAKRAAAA
jgi:plasmid replication initiation protein